MTCPSTALPRRAFSLAVALVLLTGCALSARQKAAVGQFSESATTLRRRDVVAAEGDARRDGRDDEAAAAAGRQEPRSQPRRPDLARPRLRGEPCRDGVGRGAGAGGVRQEPGGAGQRLPVGGAAGGEPRSRGGPCAGGEG